MTVGTWFVILFFIFMALVIGALVALFIIKRQKIYVSGSTTDVATGSAVLTATSPTPVSGNVSITSAQAEALYHIYPAAIPPLDPDTRIIEIEGQGVQLTILGASETSGLSTLGFQVTIPSPIPEKSSLSSIIFSGDGADDGTVDDAFDRPTATLASVTALSNTVFELKYRLSARLGDDLVTRVYKFRFKFLYAAA